MSFTDATVAALAQLLPPSFAAKLKPGLLERPPFRFLHDITSEIQRTTGFAPGLFGEGERDARTLDKEGKLFYLQKLADAIGTVLGRPVPARPSKIVAGLEPENTNLMLQMLAEAAQRGGGAAAVQTVLKRAAAAPVRGAARAATSSSQAAPEWGQPAVPQLEVSAEERGSGAEVVFTRLDNHTSLLPSLARKVDDARGVLTAAAAAIGSQQALVQCGRVQGMAQDAVVLAKCLEVLQSSAHAIVSESAAWGREADKLAARLQEEEQAEAQAAAASERQLAQLETAVAAARQRVAAMRRG